MRTPYLPAAILAATVLLPNPPWVNAAPIGNPAPPLPSADLAWWREARFGMFIHWGPVSLRGTEIGWSRGDSVPVEEYDALYRNFDPTRFNAREWARLARDAGMRYVILTTKHHDGFCLWNTRETDYNIMNTPFARDVTGELAKACRREGLVFGMYHSLCDWRHPDYPLGSPGGRTAKAAPDMDRYNLFLKHQLRELLTGYGRVGVLWFDGEWEAPWTEERGRDLYAFCRSIQPRVIINNRVGKGRQDMEGTTVSGAFGGDYDTPEQRVGTFQNTRPWESCITICQQWAWKPDDQLKSFEECVRILVQTVGGDGNLLLNVGPMPDGTIEPRQADRLREIGDWLRQNGKAIYDTRGGPFKPGDWGASTHRGKSIFVHSFQPPSDGPLWLPALDARILKARTFRGAKVTFQQTESATLVELPQGLRQPIDTIVELRLDRPASQIRPR